MKYSYEYKKNCIELLNKFIHKQAFQHVIAL